MRWLPIRNVLLVVALAALAACAGGVSSDERDERDPYLRKARELRNSQDYEGAIGLYQKALERKPALARAHLELGLIYDQELNDDVRAIYHYQRYLELRPNADKKELVQDLIGHAKLSFSASLPERPKEAVREIELLKKEVATLRNLLAEARGAPTPAGAATPPARPAAPNAPAVSTAPPPATAATETYLVQAGDTLSRIATKVYNDPTKWNAIYDANRDKLPSPKSIKVGDKLVIPR